MQIPQVLITAILGLVVLFVITTDYFVRQRVNRRVALMVAETADSSTPPPAAEAST
jgi:hypothetical protein